MKSTSRTLNSKQKTNKVLIVLILCTLAITLIILGQFLVLDYNTNKILQDGTIINGINLSKLNKDEANVILVNEFTNKANDFSLTINAGDKSWTYTNKDFQVNEDLSTLIDISQDKQTLLNTDEEITLVSQFEKIGGNVNASFNYVYIGLDEKINNIIKELEKEPIDSRIEYSSITNTFNITDSENGLRVDRNSLYNDINNQFVNTNNINVDIKYIEEIPDITRGYNEDLTHLIAKYSTNVADSTGGRKNNVRLALDRFNGFILEPNKEISFNHVTGPHTVDSGYQTATVIYNGEFTDGIGGGICQASSTLYNALLLSGVDIIEVHKHTLPVRYVPLALDAMVSEFTSDLRFINRTEYPMFIKTYSDSQSVTVEIYSHPSDYTYKTTSETIDTISNVGDKIIPDTEGKYSSKVLFKGEYFRLSYPKDGYIAKAYLEKYKDGELIDSKEIRSEIYQAQQGVVIEGTEQLPYGVSPIDNGVKIIKPEN